MNRQEVFDKVCVHLIRQSAKSTMDTQKCAYRGVGGLQCAIGCLIPDDLYLGEFEGLSPITLNENWNIFDKIYGGIVNRDDLRFLDFLQWIHDDSPVALWGLKLKEFANNHGLIWNSRFDD